MPWPEDFSKQDTWIARAPQSMGLERGHNVQGNPGETKEIYEHIDKQRANSQTSGTEMRTKYYCDLQLRRSDCLFNSLQRCVNS